MSAPTASSCQHLAASFRSCFDVNFDPCRSHTVAHRTGLNSAEIIYFYYSTTIQEGNDTGGLPGMAATTSLELRRGVSGNGDDRKLASIAAIRSTANATRSYGQPRCQRTKVIQDLHIAATNGKHIHLIFNFLVRSRTSPVLSYRTASASVKCEGTNWAHHVYLSTYIFDWNPHRATA